MESDALLGRTTYEGFADAWPSREGAKMKARHDGDGVAILVYESA